MEFVVLATSVSGGFTSGGYSTADCTWESLKQLLDKLPPPPEHDCVVVIGKGLDLLKKAFPADEFSTMKDKPAFFSGMRLYGLTVHHEPTFALAIALVADLRRSGHKPLLYGEDGGQINIDQWHDGPKFERDRVIRQLVDDLAETREK